VAELVTSGWNIILRTVAVYLAILVDLRLAGEREIGQMTVFDLVVLLLIANAYRMPWWGRTLPFWVASSGRPCCCS